MDRVHVATLNIRNLADRWFERLPLLLNDMSALQPDLLGLQEVVYPMQQDRLIDKIAFHKACRKDRATLHHQPRDALLGENLENLLQVEPVAALVDAKDLAALFLKDLFGNL